MSRGQLSMEFILLFTLTFVVFLVLVGVAISSFGDRSQQSAIDATDALTESMALHLDLIGRGPGDVTYAYPLPNKLDGESYSMALGTSGIIIVRIPDAGVVSMRRTMPFSLSSSTPGFITDNGVEDSATLSVDRPVEDPACEIGFHRSETGQLEVTVDAC